MDSCSEMVTKRDPYMLPPNTWEVQCSREAVDTWIGRPVCRQHKQMHIYSRYRAILRQCTGIPYEDIKTKYPDLFLSAVEAGIYKA